MNERTPPPSAWRLAALPLAASAAMAVMALGVAGATYWLVQQARTDTRASAARLAAANEGLRTSQVARAKLEVNLAKFEELSAGKFVGVPDRLTLLEGVERAASLWPKGLLRWELGPQRTVSTINDEATGTPLAEVRVIPMRLSAANVHEVAWIEFVEALQRQSVGYFRVDACELTKTSFEFLRRSVPATNAACNLSWVFVVPQNGAEPAK